MTSRHALQILLGLLLVVLICVSSPEALAQRIYRFYNTGDWVSYTNTRYVTSIARGFDVVYFGTTGGILRYNLRSDEWLDPLTISDGMPENWVRQLVVDRMTDEIWVQGQQTTSYFNPTFDEWRNDEPFLPEKVQPPGITIAQLPQLITEPGYFYFPQGILTDQKMMQYRITQLLSDDADVVWMGVWGLGPAKADLRRVNLELLRFGPYDDDIACLDRDDDDFWFLGGTDGLPGTISHYDRANGKWEYFEPVREAGIISDQFYAVTHDDNNVWIGTELGLVRLDKNDHSFRSYSHFDGIYGERVTAILPLKGSLLIGTEQGVSVLDFARDSIYAANSNNIRGQIVNDFAARNRTIYAATETGIYSLDWGASQWNRLSLSSPLLKAAVYDIQIVDSLLYTVGEDGVVVLNLNDNSVTVYDRTIRFQNARLTTLLVHQGVIWAGGDDGLFRLNARTGNWYRYGVNDGLISTRVSSLVADGDYVWIGTDKGVSRFLWKSFNRSDWLQ
jgi:ligand-binding sensor domain-containing protein